MSGAVRVGHGDPQIRLVERRIVIAAVPDNHVRFLLGLFQYRRVVDARVDDYAVAQVRLVLLTFLDGAVVQVEVVIRCKTLHRLPCQVAVGHRVANSDGFLAHVGQDMRDATRHLALAATRPYRGHGDHRL